MFNVQSIQTFPNSKEKPVSITQRRPAVRMRRERTLKRRYCELRVKFENMRRLHPEEGGCHKAYSKLRAANENLMKYVESIADYFSKAAKVDDKSAAKARLAGHAELAAEYVLRAEQYRTLSEKAYLLLFATIQCGSAPSE